MRPHWQNSRLLLERSSQGNQLRRDRSRKYGSIPLCSTLANGCAASVSCQGSTNRDESDAQDSVRRIKASFLWHYDGDAGHRHKLWIAHLEGDGDEAIPIVMCVKCGYDTSSKLSALCRHCVGQKSRTGQVWRLLHGRRPQHGKGKLIAMRPLRKCAPIWWLLQERALARRDKSVDPVPRLNAMCALDMPEMAVDYDEYFFECES